ASAPTTSRKGASRTTASTSRSTRSTRSSTAISTRSPTRCCTSTRPSSSRASRRTRDVLTLKAALEEATEAIGRVDAHVLMAHLLGVDRAYLAAHPMRFLSESEDARLASFVAQRSLGAPVAYLLRKRE